MSYPITIGNEKIVSDLEEIGLTKRELFAAIALQGLLSNKNYKGEDPDRIVKMSVHYADRLIDELNGSYGN